MSTDNRLRWFIRDVVPGDVSIGDPGPGDFEFRATVRVTATVINGCGGRSEIRFDAYAGFPNHGRTGDVVGHVVKNGIKGAREAAQAFCDAANAEHDWAIRNDAAAPLDAKARCEIAPNFAGA
jgi:hypothetical protein